MRKLEPVDADEVNDGLRWGRAGGKDDGLLGVDFKAAQFWCQADGLGVEFADSGDVSAGRRVVQDARGSGDVHQDACEQNMHQNAKPEWHERVPLRAALGLVEGVDGAVAEREVAGVGSTEMPVSKMP